LLEGTQLENRSESERFVMRGRGRLGGCRYWRFGLEATAAWLLCSTPAACKLPPPCEF
jgi:hypothetical protein